MMRGTIVVAACSMLAVAALVGLGLNVPTEEMVIGSRDSVTIAEQAPEIVGATPIVAGSRAPSVPALALRSADPVSETDPVSAAPTRVRVPALDIDAAIVAAGVDPNGAFEVPDPREVGWYVHGPVPGEPGAAVLAAHVDLGHVAGVFYHLDDVLLGDRVYIDLDDGTSLTFEVVDDVLYDKTALPQDELFRRSGDPVVHLVTCGGVFDPENRHYLGNRVVTARLID